MTVHLFGGKHFDRAAELRSNLTEIGEILSGPAARLVPMHRGRSLLQPGEPMTAALVTTDAWRDIDSTRCVLLGRHLEYYCFAVDMSHVPEDQLAEHGQLADLRLSGPMLGDDDAALLACARALLLWHREHQFCGRCGARNEAHGGGHVLRCSDPDCGRSQFPRIDPAIIVLVDDGPRCLLGRQASWPPQRYSTIAGFVEPGESLEDAVAREVGEETGVRVKDPIYHSSQPWPFPSSLMLGFHAQAADFNITLRDEELEDARWFTRRDILDGLIKLPPRVSISFRLIEEWFNRGDEGALLQRLPSAGSW